MKTIKAGIIGEIGTSVQVLPNEEKVLRAAARAHLATGAAVNVHLEVGGREGHRVLDILAEEGMALDRVILSHLDQTLSDPDYHRTLMDRGDYIEYDTFGSEFYYDQWHTQERRDTERVAAVAALVRDGYAERSARDQQPRARAPCAGAEPSLRKKGHRGKYPGG